MRRAIQYLVERGMLVRKRGVGTQVVHPKVRRPVELSSLYDDLVKAGPEAAHRGPGAARSCPATDARRQALGVPGGAEVTWIERLRYAGGEPLALMHNAVPVDVLPAAPRRPGRRAGCTSCCAPAGHVPRMATQVIGARSATAAEARMLRREARRAAADDDPHRVGRGAAGPLEYGSHLYRASRYSFELNLTS